MQHCSLNNEATAISMLFPFLSSSQISGVCLHCCLRWAKSQRKENIQEWTTQRSLCFPKQTHIFIFFFWLSEKNLYAPPKPPSLFSPPTTVLAFSHECHLLMLPHRSPGKCSSNTLHQQLPAVAMWSRQCA